jgi:hypothetical protein
MAPGSRRTTPHAPVSQADRSALAASAHERQLQEENGRIEEVDEGEEDLDEGAIPTAPSLAGVAVLTGAAATGVPRPNAAALPSWHAAAQGSAALNKLNLEDPVMKQFRIARAPLDNLYSDDISLMTDAQL